MVVVFGLIIMFEVIKTEDGQWIEVCGIPYFCPDYSSYCDYISDEDELEPEPNYNSNPKSKSQTGINFDEF